MLLYSSEIQEEERKEEKGIVRPQEAVVERKEREYTEGDLEATRQAENTRFEEIRKQEEKNSQEKAAKKRENERQQADINARNTQSSRQEREESERQWAAVLNAQQVAVAREEEISEQQEIIRQGQALADKIQTRLDDVDREVAAGQVTGTGERVQAAGKQPHKHSTKKLNAREELH